MKLCSDSQCRRKGDLLPFSEFSAHRGKKNNLNIYCRECRKRRCAEYRDRTLHETVLSAIKGGHRTREQIEIKTGLNEELIADAVAYFWDRSQIRITEGRYYLTRKAA